MSPYERLIRAMPPAFERARRSPMAARLEVDRPWLRFAAFLALAAALIFGANLTVGIALRVFPEAGSYLASPSWPLPEGPLRLFDEGVLALRLCGLLALLAFAILLAAGIAYRQPLSAFLWPSRRFDIRQFSVGVLAMSCVAVMALPFYVWQGSEWAPPILDGLYLDWTRPVYGVLMAASLFMAAAAEEAVCRGVMLRLMTLVVRHPLILCLLNGLVFSSLHLDPNPVTFAARAFSGMAWTWAALRLGGLEFAIGAHMANNLIITLIWAPLSETKVGADTPWIMLAPEAFSALVMVAIVERLANREVDAAQPA